MVIGKIFIVTTFLLTGFFSYSSSQERASATVGATIVIPIGVTNNADSSLGNNNLINGSVILTPLPTTVTEDVKTAVPAGSSVSAAYSINDQGAYTYSITLPATVGNGINTLAVTSSSKSTVAKGKDAKTSETLKISVILKESGSQAGEINIPITVNYN